MSAAKQAGGKGQTEKGKQSAVQKKWTRTTSQAPTIPPASLAADGLCWSLESSRRHWCRTWAADRTFMLRRTSKGFKEVVEKMTLPAVVRFSRIFWDDARNARNGKAER
jgi:hypothetical protein